MLQIPFGWLSDRIGRKPVIILGLVLFSIGSFICAKAGNINELIIARILQGSGAIGSVAIATLGDITRSQVRAQAFSITGIIIGSAFILSILLGPLLASKFGFNSLFYILSALGIISLIITVFLFPDIKSTNSGKTSVNFYNLISQFEIRRLFISTSVNSFIMNLFFFIYPLSWYKLGTEQSDLWKIYLIVFVPSAIFVFLYLRHFEKKARLKTPIIGAWIILFISIFGYFTIGANNWNLYLIGATFFIGNIFYQSLLPAFLTQRIPSENRGSATGFYNLSSFLGAAIGGMLTGLLYNINESLPLLVALMLLLIWLKSGLPNAPEKDGIS